MQHDDEVRLQVTELIQIFTWGYRKCSDFELHFIAYT